MVHVELFEQSPSPKTVLPKEEQEVLVIDLPVRISTGQISIEELKCFDLRVGDFV